MPIYEFYCATCHTVFNFLSRSVDTEKRPACPRCGRPGLDRQVSLFAISKGRKDAEQGDLPDVDDEKMERAMEALAGEMEGVDEEDPRQMARVLRKLYGATGLELGAGMEEAIRRMEAGEDPDAIEEQMGDLLEGEEALGPGGGGLKAVRRTFLPPAHDDTLYEL